MDGYIVADTNIIIDVLNGYLSKDDALELYSSLVVLNARFGFTIFTYYELLKNIDDKNGVHDIISKFYRLTDFILTFPSISTDARINPSYWAEMKEFDYDNFQVFFGNISKNIINFLIDYIAIYVLSSAYISLLIKSSIGSIPRQSFIKFCVSSADVNIAKRRDIWARDQIVKMLSNDWKDKEKSKQMLSDMINFFIKQFMNANDRLGSINLMVTSDEINQFIKSKTNFTRQLREKRLGDFSSPKKLVDSLFRHYNRSNSRNILISGINLLFDDACFGRKTSVNDFIDICNISCIDTTQPPNSRCYYVTTDSYWLNNFIYGYESENKKMINCKIVSLRNI